MSAVKKSVAVKAKRKAESMYEEVSEKDTIRIVSTEFVHMKAQFSIFKEKLLIQLKDINDEKFKAQVIHDLDRWTEDMRHMQDRIHNVRTQGQDE